jgi:hypothetical protein
MAEWNVYCTTERTFVQTWGTPNIVPTHCPHDVTHILNPQSGSINRISRIRLAHTTILTTQATSYTPLINFITQGEDIVQYDHVYPVSIKIVASIDVGSYDYQIVLLPDETVLYESTNNTNTTPTITNIPITDLSPVPSTEHTIDFRFRTNNGGTLTIRNVSIYFAVPPT